MAAAMAPAAQPSPQIPYMRHPAPQQWPQPAPSSLTVSSHPYGLQPTQQAQPRPYQPSPSPVPAAIPPPPAQSQSAPATAPPPKPSASAVQDEAPAGSCPGGGVCNGQGGQTCCQGCPALNNRLLYSGGDAKARQAMALTAAAVAGAEAEGKSTAGDVGVMECFNCQTSESTRAMLMMLLRSAWRPRAR